MIKKENTEKHKINEALSLIDKVSPFLVSVAITTYNHEKYISQCIESILNQKCNFEYEIILGEDCSTDNTLLICEDFENRYPSKIRLLKREENLGLRKNNFEVWSSCKGKYIAYLEGDDFWTNDNKLQSQIDYLENHPDLIGSGHQTFKWFENNPQKNIVFSSLDDLSVIDFKQNIEKWLFATCSFVFKNFFIDGELEELRSNFAKDALFWTDRPLMVFLSLYGDFIYHGQNMGCWRQHEQNMTRKGDLPAMNVAGAHAYKKNYKMYPSYSLKIKELIVRWYLLASEESLKNKNFVGYLKYSFYALFNVSSLESLKNIIKSNYYMLIGKKIYK